MPDTAALQPVRNALEAMAQRRMLLGGDELTMLDARVRDAVEELKAMGFAAEHIIIRMKEVAREAGLHARADARLPDTDAVVAEVVRVCIATYYDGAR